MLKKKYLFKIKIFYNKDIKSLHITAKSDKYLADIKPLRLSNGEIDKHNFHETVANLKRLADIITPFVNIFLLL